MKLLITDLDNTLYDWVKFFAISFEAMVAELASLIEVDKKKLKAEFKKVHQRHGSTEYPFAILELPSVQRHFKCASRADLLEYVQGPLEAFRRARDKHLQLYPSVYDTLQRLRAMDIPVVGHTEAIAELAFKRIQMLGILPLFTRLYALDGRLEPHPDPRRDSKSFRLHQAFVTFVPKEEKKPNPALLADICSREGVPLHKSVYVGDSLTRDMSMAKAAGVCAVWAKYGTRYSAELWKDIVRVTHWTDEDVKQEVRLRELFRYIRPDYTIDSFSETLKLFVSASSKAAPKAVRVRTDFS